MLPHAGAVRAAVVSSGVLLEGIMIRTIFGCLAAIIYLIVGIPILGIEYLIAKKDKKKADLQSLHMVQWIFRVIYRICGTKIDVIHHEKVPNDQPVLYVCNHRSYFDIIISYSFCPNLTGYIAKDNIAKVPLLNIWMKRLYCLFISRDNPRESIKTLKKAEEQIQHGISMCIFPEGTRNSGDQLLPFKEGSLKIASRTGCLIVPVAILNTDNIIKNHMPIVKPSHVIIEYGDPIDPKKFDRKEQKHLGHICQERIQEMLDRNRKLI